MRNVASVSRTPVERLLGPGSRNVVDLASGSGLTSEGGTVSIVVGDVDEVGGFALELMSDGPDKPVDALPTLWECDFDHALGSSPGLAVKVEGDFLGKSMAGIAQLLSWGQGDRVGVRTVVAVASMDVESTERRSDPSTE